MMRHGIWKSGIDHRGKLDEAKVREIRTLAPSMTQQALAKKFGVHNSLINRILLGKIWRHVSA